MCGSHGACLLLGVQVTARLGFFLRSSLKLILGVYSHVYYLSNLIYQACITSKLCHNQTKEKYESVRKKACGYCIFD